MTQREIDKRVGLKGRTRQFTFPVSESSFSGDRVMFNDTGSVRLDYSLDNKNGIPTVDTDLIHLSSGNERYYQQALQPFAGEQMGRRRRDEYMDGVPRIGIRSTNP